MKISGQQFPAKWWVPFLGIGGLLVLGVTIMVLVYSGSLVSDADESRILVERETPSLDELTRAIELNPTYLEAYRKRARLLADRQRYTEALSDLDKALTLSPGNQELLILRAQLSAQRASTSRPSI